MSGILSVRRVLCASLLTLGLFSAPASFAQKGASKGCLGAVVIVDTFIAQQNWGAAQAVLDETLATNPELSCKRKLLALTPRMRYWQGDYRGASSAWAADSALFETMARTATSVAMPYPENTAFLFAGLSDVRAGNWISGGRLTTIGVKNVGYNVLRQLKLEEGDMHYLAAGLGAGMDTIPDMASPLIGLVLGKWESSGNHLSVIPNGGTTNHYIGRALVEYKQWTTAIPFLQQAMAKPEKHLYATEYLLGKCYNELGQYDKAVALLKPLFENDKSDWVTAELERAQDGANGRGR